jgi:hypothetical protein
MTCPWLVNSSRYEDAAFRSCKLDFYNVGNIYQKILQVQYAYLGFLPIACGWLPAVFEGSSPTSSRVEKGCRNARKRKGPPG